MRHLLPSLLLGYLLIARAAVDWFAPTPDFHFRSQVTTFGTVVLLALAGFVAARRADGSVLRGALAGVATGAWAAAIGITGIALLLVVHHDPATLAAARDSGGLTEAFTLPLGLIAAGGVLGAAGSAVSVGWSRFTSPLP